MSLLSRIAIATWIWIAAGAVVAALPPDEVNAPMSDRDFFEKVNLDFPGLGKVRSAVEADDLGKARSELAAYYRERKGNFHYVGDSAPEIDAGRLLRAARPLVDREGEYGARFWSDEGLFDWEEAEIRWKERMYFFESFGRAAALEEGDEIAESLVSLMRGFVHQFTRMGETEPPMSFTMNTGIRMRSGWPVAFLSLLESEAFTDGDILLFLKSVWDQTDYLRRNHSETSNWLTFELAGLYTSGAVYPEFKDADDWRRHAIATAVEDMDRGWLPDGMTIELSPGYGRYFSNYFFIYDLAKHTGREEEFNVGELLAKTERPFESYLRIMAPDRFAPATNNNRPVSVVEILEGGLERFPEREDFSWVVSDGETGAAPDFTSTVLPYGGFAAMRSGWEREANMLYFDFGPVGYRHAHQDGLNVMLWAYGRQVLFDPGLVGYEYGTPFVDYAVDTFSHNTALVDGRPQRRIWYENPHPKRMPYEPLDDFQWETNDRYDFAAGIYDEAYGDPKSAAYPYSDGSDFMEGWVYPARHHRRVLFIKPDVFVIADTLVSKDGEPHQYELRWHLDSTNVRLDREGLAAVTADDGKPNLEVVPLFRSGLSVETAVAQETPELLGWRVAESNNPLPATTVRHLKDGGGAVQFVTLLLPLREGTGALLESVEVRDHATVEIVLSDSRKYLLRIPEDPKREMSASAN